MSGDKRFDIQGLRAWAVLSVLIFHFFPAEWPYGFLGVDVFLVLSGFLIALVLKGKSFNFDTLHTFFLRRIKRIFPMAAVVALINILLIWTYLREAEIVRGFKSALYSLLFAKNLMQQDTQEAYFEALDSANDLFTHFWSLSLEIQFYLIAPFIMLTVSKLSGVRGGIHLSFLLLAIISIVSFFYGDSLEAEEAFASTLGRLWQFMFGAFAFQIHGIIADNKTEPISTARKTAFLIPLFLACAQLSIVFKMGISEPILRTTMTLFVTIMLICNFKTPILCHRWLQILGDASYALYLIHWPVVCMLKVFEIEEWQWKLLAATLCVVFSLLCYFYYEQWYLSLPTWDCLWLIGLLYLACGGCLIFLPKTAAIDPDVAAALADWNAESTRNLTEKETAYINEQFERWTSKNMTMEGCVKKDGKNSRFFCILPNGTGTLKFLMIGNSHTDNVGPHVVKHFKKHYGVIKSRSVPACSPYFDQWFYHCPAPEVVLKIYDEDVRTERPDVLMIITRFVGDMGPLIEPIRDDPVFKRMLERVTFFEQFVSTKVLLMDALPTPLPLDPVEKKRRAKGLPIEAHMPEAVESMLELMSKRIHEVAKYCKKCAVFDMRQLVLDEQGRFTVVHPITKLRYYDWVIHLTPMGMKQIEPFFVKMSKEFPAFLKSKYPENIMMWNSTPLT